MRKLKFKRTCIYNSFVITYSQASKLSNIYLYYQRISIFLLTNSNNREKNKRESDNGEVASIPAKK